MFITIRSVFLKHTHKDEMLPRATSGSYDCNDVPSTCSTAVRLYTLENTVEYWCQLCVCLGPIV